MSHSAAISPSSFTTFGDLLRYLRRRARLQQRDLAIAVGYSEGQICRLEQNQRLPDLTTLAARFIPALDIEDEPQLVARLLELAAAARGERVDVPADEPRPEPQVGNLPTPLTPLINRTREVATVGAYLERSDVRLLTLVGPPGIGKTRLGLHVAAKRQALFPEGVFFVALAPIRDPALVLPAIAHALGMQETSGQPSIQALRARLGDRQLLLVLDNFEQVAAAAPQVSELLRAAPRAKALVTSRAALHLSGEHLFVVPPLELPASRDLPLAQLASSPAVQLFLSRVRATKPDFELTAENARAVVEICASLDGLPLAIELAAARGRLFNPQALLDRLRGASGPTVLQFLVDGPRDLLVHQQTLRSTIDWSYDLLDANERALLMRLGVFVGGCTEAAVAAICGDRQAGRAACADPQPAILDMLLSLVDKSLLKCELGADETPRYMMLETIREYARQKLEAAGQAGIVRERHAAYYLELALAAEPELTGAHQEGWFARLEQEYNNLWAALEWYAAEDATTGLRLACSLRQFWHGRGHLHEGRSWLERMLALEHSQDIPDSVRARALCVGGFLAYQQGDLKQAIAMSEASLTLYRAAGDRCGIADSLLNLGSAAYYHNEYVRATALYTEALVLYRQQGVQVAAALVLKNLGLVAKDQGDFTRATAFYEESQALYRAAGDKRGDAQSFFNLGVVAYWQGDYARAVELSESGLSLYRELSDKMGVSYILDTLGMALYKKREYDRAIRLLEESLRLLRELGDKVGIALLLTDMGVVAQAEGNIDLAAQLHHEGLELAWNIGDKRRVAFCLEGLALAVVSHQPLHASRLFGVAESLREAIGSPLPAAEHDVYEQGLAAARADDPTAFAAAWAAGSAMPLEQAISYVLNHSQVEDLIAPSPPRSASHR
jgi:predicted ATPase